MVMMNTTIQTFVKTLTESLSDTTPLRRSQCVKDLKTRRNEQPETKLRENRQKISRVKSQRLKERALKD
ncbi:hypothetical protein AJ78_02952 [Emergomyces pasteurianus Ep9510]|uniref:Uncharacterized protein n=1 Tax=Emergomyces pasteurianus Ep9510 TaxID=1447872 RepID=A0A1J9Q9J5_9EURO|nr:hypothetical protein AJ78_02952 [Emergomyces pasteurianus Ep9510]